MSDKQLESLIDRLKHHSNDKNNTAFSRSTMREAEQLLTRLQSLDTGIQEIKDIMPRIVD